jgi:serine/threonine protein kinase
MTMTLETSSRSTQAEATARHAAGHVVGGKYVLERCLGEGRGSRVWRAQNMALGTGVALKLLAGVHRAPDAVERLLREARVEARLRQPGVVRVFDVEQSEVGDSFIAMELLEGQTLAALVEERGQLGAVEAARMLLPVVAVLVAVHATGVAHGNLEAANIILVPLDGGLRPTLVDFDGVEPASGVIADILAMRRILHEVVAGQAPFDDLAAPGPASMRELAVSLARFLLAQGVSTDASGVEVAGAWLRSKQTRAPALATSVPSFSGDEATH